MFNEKKLVDKIISFSKFDETEVTYYEDFKELTRFGNNEISQNVSSRNLTAEIRVIKGKKTASIYISDFSDVSIKNAYNKLEKIIDLQPEDERLFPLEGNKVYETKISFDEKLSNITPQWKADNVAEIVNKLKEENIVSAGIISNNKQKLIFSNSKNLYGENINGTFSFSISSKKGENFTREEIGGFDEKNFNPKEIYENIKKKLNWMNNKINIKEGRYDVILTPDAFGEFLSYMLWFSFSGKYFLENRTFLVKELNKKIFPDFFNLIDDPLNNGNPVYTFDFEGIPVQTKYLIKNGIPCTILTNRYLSKKLNVPNTGNGFSIPSQEVFPIYPKVEKGNTAYKEIIKNTKKGLFINNFHYMNIIDPMELSVTGMTRDGVFLIENGEIVGATNNLRFTESIIEAIKRIEVLSSELKNVSFFEMSFIEVPYAKIKDFNFTSVTNF
ncbi:MAG: TldD/PmbA family protein [Spirochaetes bacterium]|nr:TldD/PmbA family protein [Spirochaetota bacterium]